MLQLHPWFVSDVTVQDFTWTLEMLRASDDAALNALGTRWHSCLSQGTFVVETHPFWTQPEDYACMRTAAEDLYTRLSQAALVVFKGDLNYRKLVGDLRWPMSTSFATALRGFHPCALTVLRTVKGDVCVGLSDVCIRKMGEQFANSDEWMTCGEYAVIEYDE